MCKHMVNYLFRKQTNLSSKIFFLFLGLPSDAWGPGGHSWKHSAGVAGYWCWSGATGQDGGMGGGEGCDGMLLELQW